MFPTISEDIQREVDEEGVRSIQYVALSVSVFELFSLAVFIATRIRFDSAVWISIRSVLFCIAACLCGYFVARHFSVRQEFVHGNILAFKVIFFLAMSIWGILVSYRHYEQGEQMLTFFTVEMLMVCFVVFRPVLSILMMFGAYAGLLVLVYAHDGAAEIQVINYVIFMVVSALGMVVRFHSQLNAAEKRMALQQSNERLAYFSRHDELTGLRNRRALEEDSQDFVNKTVSVSMVDINKFKKVNDTYGHYAGDAILQETSRQLRSLFPGCHCYRYGGDEFLIVGCGKSPRDEALYSFPCQIGEEMPALTVDLSIGHAEGKAIDQRALFNLIKEADDSLYDVKGRLL